MISSFFLSLVFYTIVLNSLSYTHWQSPGLLSQHDNTIENVRTANMEKKNW